MLYISSTSHIYLSHFNCYILVRYISLAICTVKFDISKCKFQVLILPFYRNILHVPFDNQGHNI
jgi:hypothetical protein